MTISLSKTKIYVDKKNLDIVLSDDDFEKLYGAELMVSILDLRELISFNDPEGGISFGMMPGTSLNSKQNAAFQRYDKARTRKPETQMNQDLLKDCEISLKLWNQKYDRQKMSNKEIVMKTQILP